MNQNKKQTCTCCKKDQNESEFMKNNKILKTCITCRQNKIKLINRNRCEHKRQSLNASIAMVAALAGKNAVVQVFVFMILTEQVVKFAAN